MQSRELAHQFATVLEDMADGVIVHVYGDLDISCSPEFETTLDEAAAHAPRGSIVVDLQECQYMDSTGLTALVRAIKRYGSRVEAIVSERSVIARLMRVANFEKVLPITFTSGPYQFS